MSRLPKKKTISNLCDILLSLIPNMKGAVIVKMPDLNQIGLLENKCLVCQELY